MCRFDLSPLIPPTQPVPRIQVPLHIMTAASQTPSTTTSEEDVDQTIESIFQLAQLMRDRHGIVVTPMDTTPPVSPPHGDSPPPSPPPRPPRRSRLRHVLVSP